MLMAKRNMMGGSSWVNPYITDGLVAIWDRGEGFKGEIVGTTFDTTASLDENGDAVLFNAKSTDFVFGEYGAFSFEICCELTENRIRHEFKFGYDVSLKRGCTVAMNGGINLQIQYLSYLANGGAANQVGSSWEGHHSFCFQLCGSETQTGTPKRLYRDGATVWNYRFNGYNYPLDNYVELVNNGSLKINSIRIYNRMLETAEIAANYAIDKARFGLT